QKPSSPPRNRVFCLAHRHSAQLTIDLLNHGCFIRKHHFQFCLEIRRNRECFSTSFTNRLPTSMTTYAAKNSWSTNGYGWNYGFTHIESGQYITSSFSSPNDPETRFQVCIDAYR